MNILNTKALMAMAEEAREASYSPYSGITVGAALLTKEGKIYKGANIENASYTPTVCAERVAFFKAILRTWMERQIHHFKLFRLPPAHPKKGFMWCSWRSCIEEVHVGYHVLMAHGPM